MKIPMRRYIALVILAVMLIGILPVAPIAAATTHAFYGDYDDVATVYDYGSCPSMQGLAVGSQKMYTIKINGSDNLAVITMTDKDTGSSTRLYNVDAGSYYFNYMGHANDMDVWGIDGYSNIFVTSTNEGSNAIVRLKRDGNNLTKVASYRLTYNGVDTCATAMAIRSVSGGMINFITKLGMNIYTGSVSVSATSATIPLTKLCTIDKSKVYIKGVEENLTDWVNQGFGYYENTLFVPVTGPDDQLNRSVIMVYNLDNVVQGSTIYPTESIVFRVTSGAYSALFEIESCDICSGDKKMYFNTNRRVTNSDTNHDGVSYFMDYTFSKPAYSFDDTKHYVVRYDANGGSGTMEDTAVPYGVTTALRKNAFTKTGYKFVGWHAYRTTQNQWYYTNGSSSGWYKEGSQPSGYTKSVYSDGAGVAKTTSVHKDLTIFEAQWEPIDYTITWTVNGQQYAQTTARYGETISAPAYTAPTGYHFSGWTVPATMPAQNLTLDATLTSNNYTVTWVVGGTSTFEDYQYGETPVFKGSTDKASDGCTTYTFAGWDKKIAAVTGNVTYTATYTQSTNHSWKDATCTSPMTCGNCGETQGESLGHKYEAEVLKPTCTAGGYTTHTCRVCGDNYQDNFLAPSGHSYDDGEVTTQPDCATTGVITFTCGSCGAHKTEDVASVGHSWSNGNCITCGEICTHTFENGTCTTCGMVKPAVLPVLNPTGATLSLEGEVMYKVYFNVDDPSFIKSMGMLTFNTQPANGNMENADEVISKVELVNGTYIASSNGIPAKMLGDEVYICLYAQLEDGTYVYSRVIKYSGKIYADYMLDYRSDDPGLQQVVVAMLNYGAEAQTFFGYKTDSLMNADLTESEKNMIVDYNSTLVPSRALPDAGKTGNFPKSDKFSYRSASMVLEGALAINYRFVPSLTPASGLTLYYWTEDTYNSVDALSLDNIDGQMTMEQDASGYYTATYDGLAAKQMGDVIYIAAVYESNGETHTTGVIAYSLYTYCNDAVTYKQPSAEIAKAAAVYGYYAEKYFGN